MTSTRRGFFASIAGLGISRPRAEQPVWKQMRPYSAAEEKEINDRWERIDATLDRIKADL